MINNDARNKILSYIKDPSKRQEKMELYTQWEEEKFRCEERKKKNNRLQRVRYGYKILLVDAENCSCSLFDKVKEKYDKLDATNVGIFIYGLEEERFLGLKNWTKYESDLIKCVWVNQWSAKNAIDNVMITKTRKLLYNLKYDKIDVICIMTNDGDFSDLITEIKNKDKCAVVYGTEKASNRLKVNADIFVEYN